jgi:hypothetical protein
MQYLISALFLLSIAVNGVFAKAGPPIPIPKHSIVQAAEIVSREFPKKARNDPGIETKDFFIMVATYTNRFKDHPLKEWSWVITFVHPIHNDHSFTFQLLTNGKVLLIEETE